MKSDARSLRAAIETLWPNAATPEWLHEDRALYLRLDSRQVTTGDVFIAVPGVQRDGREYIDAALASGAAGVLCEGEFDAPTEDGERVMTLPGLRDSLGALGQHLFAVPQSLELIGVTGTNGKSSVTHYIAALSERLGTAAGVVGTLGHGRVGRLAAGKQTTPGALELQAMLGDMATQGVRRVAMEVSSHALDQQRVEGCRFRAALFTNLSRDHLDYHTSMAAYAAAKARLFQREELALAVVNGDDPLARLMLAGLKPGVRVLASGQAEATTLRVIDWRPHAAGQQALIATPEGERELTLALLGRFNLDNVLLAMAVLYGLGESLEALFDAAPHLAPVPGRMQRLSRPDSPTVVIDYAHTPDALRNALEALREHLPRQDGGRLWCMFGCGGERDTGKRPLMAQAAQTLADQLVITDDNPRSETPAKIREQILAGLDEGERAAAWNVEGREAALQRAIHAAGPDDIVLVAGKGHEDYQEIAGERHPFSDENVVRRAFAARENGA
ncbi:UDP-N-acetylmuramoyl-L-alanyl-D-glutamate--2,6-diaminopimelate ligase [Halomonas shantousis]